MLYLWVKAAHVVFVIALMGGSFIPATRFISFPASRASLFSRR